MVAIVETEFCKFGRTVQIFFPPSHLVKMKEGVTVTSYTVAKAVAFFEKAALPNDLSTEFGNPEIVVLLVRKCFRSFQEEVDRSWSSVAPLDQLITGAAKGRREISTWILKKMPQSDICDIDAL